MENLKEFVDERNSLWQQLKFDEAIDKLYDKDITTFDNEDKTASLLFYHTTIKILHF